MICTLFGKEKY